MSPLPKEAKDLALAPVTVEIDLNLQRVRAKSPKEIQLELETELDRPIPGDRDERAQRVLDLALRYVNTRGLGGCDHGRQPGGPAVHRGRRRVTR